MIPADIDPITAKNILHRLSILYDKIRPHAGDVQKKYKQMELYFDLVKNKNFVGSNDAERKRNSALALENYVTTDGTILNMFKAMGDLEGQREDISALIDMIEKKNGMCITLSGFLKVEASLNK